MDAPDPPASVVIEMSNGDTLRGTLVKERTDRWLLDEESGRLTSCTRRISSKSHLVTSRDSEPTAGELQG